MSRIRLLAKIDETVKPVAPDGGTAAAPGDIGWQHRGDTAANWTSANPTPLARQICVETDTAKLKIGDGATAWASLPYASAVPAGGLLAANNLSDVNSAAAALANLAGAPLASPALTGTPTAPTAAPSTNTTQLATAAFVQAAIAALINSAPGALDTLEELADALGDDANFAATMTTALAGKVATTRQVIAGSGLSGGGALSSDPTLSIPANGVTSAMLAAAVRASIVSGVTAWAGTTAYTVGQVVLLPTGGLGYRTAAGTSGATFDATERDTWTFLPGGHYEKLAAGVTSWKCPVGITTLRFKLWAGGGGGGGGGTGHATTQVGGGGGGGGAVNTWQAAVTAGTSYTTSLPNGGAGGNGGAAGSNAGTNGSNGGDATIVIAGTTYTSKGGGLGNRGLAGSAASAAYGVYGVPSGVISATNYLPGGGSAGTSAGSVAASPIADGPIGGSGGSNATATLGGTGGSARTAPGALVAGVTTQTGTTSGSNGTTATEPGCGGGGGGGGAPATGVGGGGGGGGPSQLEVWF